MNVEILNQNNSTVRLTSIYNPQIEGKFTKTSGSTTSQQLSTAFLAGKRTSIFFPATTEQYIARVNLFRKPSVSFYLMAIAAIVAIH